jgi:hypothetical protein
MGDRIGYVPHTIHEVLDTVEHAVDIAVEPREFILDTGDRDPQGEVPPPLCPERRDGSH